MHSDPPGYGGLGGGVCVLGGGARGRGRGVRDSVQKFNCGDVQHPLGLQ